MKKTTASLIIILCAISILLLRRLNKPADNSSNAIVENKSSVIVSPEPVKLGSTELDSIALKVFNALKNKSENDFAKLIPTKNEIESFYISFAPKERQDEYKKKLQKGPEAENDIKETLDYFIKAIDKGNELKINWSAIIFDKLKIDSTLVKGVKSYGGEISFSENKRQFHIRFNDCFRMNTGRLAITNIFNPYEIPDAQNVNACLKYKAPYMRNCVKMIKAHPHDFLTVNNLSPEKYCECSFNTIAQQTYGADLLKDTVRLQIQPGNCNP